VIVMTRATWSTRWLGGAMIVACAVPACTGSDDEADSGTMCVGGKCDAASEGAADLLEGTNDPVGKALLAMATGETPIARLPTDEELDVDAIREAGGPDAVRAIAIEAEALEGFPAGTAGYLALLHGVAQANCADRNAVQTFVIADDLVGDGPAPRVIAATCPTDTRKASNAFLALSFLGDDGDVDAHAIEAFGWDETSRINKFYRSIPLEGSDEGILMLLNPEELEGDVGGCLDCHRGPADVSESLAGHVPAFPIMNEIVEPWSHWNAEPGFSSQMFDVPRASEMPRYQALTTKADGNIDSGDWLAGADRFELIIREGFAQVVKQRRRLLKDPADTQLALSFLRPLFCEEQVNYSSEVGVSGELALGTVIDEGIRRSITAANIGATWPWATGTEARVLVAPAASQAEALELVPMRGQSAIAWEESLVTALQKYMSPQESLQIRALDWKTPVFSDFRCGLFESTAEAPAALGTVADNHAAMKGLLGQMMTLPGGVPLRAKNPANIVVLDDPARAEALATDLEAGTVPLVECSKGSECDYAVCESTGYCEMNLWAFGERIDDYVRDQQNADGRSALQAARRERLCRVKEGDAFPMAPALPGDFTCG
jgi:hypothetical protein